MRHILLFTFFLIVSFTGRSQHFPLFSKNLIYQYTRAIGDTITAFRVDTVHTRGTDTTYVFNPIVRPTKGFLPVTLNADNVLGKEMLKKKNGDCYFIFTSGDSILIKLNVPLKQIWPACTRLKLTAQVSNKRQALTLGVIDSISTIQLSDGNKIEISKKFGIISTINFDHYFLGALKNPMTLDTIPYAGICKIGSPLTYFNFDVGTLFYYSEIGSGPGSSYSIATRVQILDKVKFGQDSIVYTIKRDNRHGGSTQNPEKHDTIKTVVSQNRIINPFYGSELLFRFKHKISNELYKPSSGSNVLILLKDKSSQQSTAHIHLVNTFDIDYEIRYREGLGMTYQRSYGWGGIIEIEQKCIRNIADLNDLCIWEDEVITASSRASVASCAQIKLNINETELLFENLQFGMNGSTTLSVVNPNGQTIYQTSSEDSLKSPIDITGWKSGIYVAILSGNKYTKAIKFVKN